MKKLIDYITVMPDEDASHDVGHKFPFTVNEIFNCELNHVFEKFFEAPEKKSNDSDSEEAKDTS